MPDTMLTAKMIHLGIQESKKWKIGNNTIRRIAYLTKPNPEEVTKVKGTRLKNAKQFEITVEQSNSYAKKLNEIFKGGSIAESFGKNFCKPVPEPSSEPSPDDSNNKIYYEKWEGYKEFVKNIIVNKLFKRDELSVIIVDAGFFNNITQNE